MSDLKMGDVVEIKYGKYDAWEDRIFLKKGCYNGVICIAEHSRKRYLSGKTFETCHWEEKEWRIKEEPEYIPFDESDAGFLLGKIGIDKKYLGKRFICEVSKNKVWFRDSWVYFQQLFEDYTFLDGTPCGKLK